MPRIKISYPFPDWPLIRQTPASSGRWGENTFYINPGEEENALGFDAWFVLDKITGKAEHTLCPPENIVCITWEPPTLRRYSNLFLRQFAGVITCHEQIRHSNKQYSLQGHPWFVGKTYDELCAEKYTKKDKLISVITSSKQFSEGHKQRYEFCLKLKEYFGDVIDLYGRGIRDFDDKWDVVAPYKYSVAIENADINDWITEKLFDCYLSLSFPFFYGCPDVDRYFSPGSYLRINLNDFNGTCKAIEETIRQPDHYEQHLPLLLQQKDKCLNQFNIFPLLSTYFQEQLSRHTKKKLCKVKNESSLFYRVTRRLFG